ncbi:MAG: DNA polymerase IV [Pseudomonadota bacterium]
MVRKILHIDMDAFYASVEQRDNPALRGQPVVVGGQPGQRGVVAAASYEARTFGLRSAMPTATAVKLCPHAVFIKPRFEHYRAVSQQIREVFSRYTDLIEPLSLDEAYLDVTAATGATTASELAKTIRNTIFEETRLTASAGVSYNKFLAKIASDINKPNGQCVIPPERAADFLARLPVGKFHGVGSATEARLHALGIETGADLRRWDEAALTRHLGKYGEWLHRIAHGIDERPVEPHHERRSVGSETTFIQDVHNLDQMIETLNALADDVATSLQRHELEARTLAIKVRYPDFSSVTRQCRLPVASDSLEVFAPLLPHLLARTEAAARGVRLLGVSTAQLSQADPTQPAQIPLPLDNTDR